MNDRQRDLAWAVAYLARRQRDVDFRIAEALQEKGLVYEPPITVWDVNDPQTLCRVVDGLELQMMGIRP